MKRKMPSDPLYTYTIYNRPADHPDKVVLRRFRITSASITPADECHVVDTLEEARAKLPPGLTRLPRYPDDHPNVVET